MQGVVRFYNAKGYGFIDRADDGGSVYFHITDVNGKTILRSGDAVEFRTVQNLKGLRALEVRLLSRATQEANYESHT